MKIQDLNYHDRPREKLLIKGVDHLRDYELLAIVLRTGYQGKNVMEVSKSIIQKYKMRALLQLTLQDLIKIKGIGKDKACTLLAAFELTKRALSLDDTSLPVIKTPQDILNQLTNIRQHKKEYFVVLYLNARCQLIHRETISIGTVNSSIVHPREVFEPAIRCYASQIVLAHNHPSGDPHPSDGDITVTKRIIKAGELMGVEVIDHVIVTKDKYISMKLEDYIE